MSPSRLLEEEIFTKDTRWVFDPYLGSDLPLAVGRRVLDLRLLHFGETACFRAVPGWKTISTKTPGTPPLLSSVCLGIKKEDMTSVSHRKRNFSDLCARFLNKWRLLYCKGYIVTCTIEINIMLYSFTVLHSIMKLLFSQPPFPQNNYINAKKRSKKWTKESASNT